VVAPVRAALQRMDPRLADRRPITVDPRTHGYDELIEGLAALGYSRTPQVERRGEFAVRGGIVDVFPTAGEQAVRIEFFGDDVESLRGFAVADQRSTGTVDEVVLDPARELLLDDQVRERAREAIARLPGLTSELDQLAEGQAFEGAEALAALLEPEPALLVDFLPEGASLALVDPLLLQERAGKLREEAQILAETAWRTTASVGVAPPATDGDGHGDGFAAPGELIARGPERRWRLTPSALLGRPNWRASRGTRSVGTSSRSPSISARSSEPASGSSSRSMRTARHAGSLMSSASRASRPCSVTS